MMWGERRCEWANSKKSPFHYSSSDVKKMMMGTEVSFFPLFLPNDDDSLVEGRIPFSPLYSSSDRFAVCLLQHICILFMHVTSILEYYSCWWVRQVFKEIRFRNHVEKRYRLSPHLMQMLIILMMVEFLKPIQQISIRRREEAPRLQYWSSCDGNWDSLKDFILFHFSLRQ